jgi:hypothetical protein
LRCAHLPERACVSKMGNQRLQGWADLWQENSPLSSASSLDLIDAAFLRIMETPKHQLDLHPISLSRRAKQVTLIGPVRKVSWRPILLPILLLLTSCMRLEPYTYSNFIVDQKEAEGLS